MARPLLDNERFLQVPDTATDGTAKDVSRFRLDDFQASGTFAGGWDVDVEGSIDGITFVTVAANVTAAGITSLAAVPKHYFFRTVVNVAGTAVGKPTFALSGMDEGAWE